MKKYRYRVERSFVETFDVETSDPKAALKQIRNYIEGKEYSGKVTLLSAKRGPYKIERADDDDSKDFDYQKPPLPPSKP